MAAYDDDSHDTGSYDIGSFSFYDILPDGAKVWVRRTVMVCRNLFFKAET